MRESVLERLVGGASPGEHAQRHSASGVRAARREIEAREVGHAIGWALERREHPIRRGAVEGPARAGEVRGEVRGSALPDDRVVGVGQPRGAETLQHALTQYVGVARLATAVFGLRRRVGHDEHRLVLGPAGAAMAGLLRAEVDRRLRRWSVVIEDVGELPQIVLGEEHRVRHARSVTDATARPQHSCPGRHGGFAAVFDGSAVSAREELSRDVRGVGVRDDDLRVEGAPVRERDAGDASPRGADLGHAGVRLEGRAQALSDPRERAHQRVDAALDAIAPEPELHVRDAVHRRGRAARVRAVVRRVAQQQLPQMRLADSGVDRRLHRAERVDLRDARERERTEAEHPAEARRLTEDEVRRRRVPDLPRVLEKARELAARRDAERALHRDEGLLGAREDVERGAVWIEIAKRWVLLAQHELRAQRGARAAEHLVDRLGHGEHARARVELDAIDDLDARLAADARARLEHVDAHAARGEAHRRGQPAQPCADDQRLCGDSRAHRLARAEGPSCERRRVTRPSRRPVKSGKKGEFAPAVWCTRIRTNGRSSGRSTRSGRQSSPMP